MPRQLQKKRGFADAADTVQQQDAIAFDQPLSNPGQEGLSSEKVGWIADRAIGDIGIQSILRVGIRLQETAPLELRGLGPRFLSIIPQMVIGAIWLEIVKEISQCFFPDVAERLKGHFCKLFVHLVYQVLHTQLRHFHGQLLDLGVPFRNEFIASSFKV